MRGERLVADENERQGDGHSADQTNHHTAERHGGAPQPENRNTGDEPGVHRHHVENRKIEMTIGLERDNQRQRMPLTGADQNAQHPQRVDAAQRLAVHADKTGGGGNIGKNGKQRQPKLHKTSCEKWEGGYNTTKFHVTSPKESPCLTTLANACKEPSKNCAVRLASPKKTSPRPCATCAWR